LANTYATKFGHEKYNGILINWYQDGNHYISKHRDIENGLKKGCTIFSLSFGATRKFRIRKYSDGSIVQDLNLDNGIIIIMGGKMQQHYTHEIVKIAGNKGANVGSRINFTCRVFQ
jgi:alkylated DNA repair dioxygenase AlkB